MPKIINYDLHGLLRFQIIREKDHGIMDLINLKYTYFKVDETNLEPDIILNIGRFVPSKENSHVVDHKYYIRNNYFYCKDSEGNANWEVEIKGFETGQTIINYKGNISGIQSIINPDFIAQILLMRFIEYKLIQKGYAFLHSAGISKNGLAYILPGRGGSYKTSFCMDFCRKRGLRLLGDDRIIISENEAFSFPMNLNLFNYIVKNFDDENGWNCISKLFFIATLFNKRNREKVNSLYVSNSPCMFKKIFFISKTNSASVDIRPIEKKIVVNKFLFNNRMEDYISLGGMGIKSGILLKYFLAYAYVIPENAIEMEQKNFESIMSKIIKDIEIYEVLIPNKYSTSLFDEVSKLILAE